MVRPLPGPNHRRCVPERRLRKPTLMTIAIGFQFNDGVLFCADTKITTDVKTNESKIVYCGYGKNNACVSVFALAGSLPYARAAIEKCENAVALLDFTDYTNTTLDRVQNAIESALTRFYRRHVGESHIGWFEHVESLKKTSQAD
jgi:20S proteasome alpha/beta subunit